MSSVSQASRETTAEDAATYRRVVDAIQDWRIDRTDGFTVESQLASHLERALDAGPAGGRHDVRTTPSRAADVAVDDAVAVLLYREFGPNAIGRFRSVVTDVGETYDYLVVVGYDLPERDIDRWRMGKARYTASRANLADVTHLSHSRGEASPTRDWPSTLWHYAEPLVALLAIVIGVEIAVLLQLRVGGVGSLLGPAATLGTALVLMVLLVLVYERTDV